MSPTLLAGLIPAAGSSRRLGRDKRRIPFRGTTVLESTVKVLRDAGLDPVVVVLEPASPCRALPGLASALLVENLSPERGMLSSIRVGLRALPDEVLGVAVLPGDHPLVPVAAVSALRDRFRERQPALLVPSHGGQRGHPLLIHRSLFAEACACDDAVGLRQLLEKRGGELQILELAASTAEEDIDDLEDLDRLRRREDGE